MNFDSPGTANKAMADGSEIELRSVQSVLAPETVAIVGVSDKGEGGWSKIIFDNLKDSGFPAKVFLINPKRDEIWGEKCYANFAAIGETVDHALLIVPAHAVCDSLREAAEQGVKSATIYSAGFGEGGGDKESKARGTELEAIAKQFGIKICGPNCMGGVAVHEEITLYPSRRTHDLRKGCVSSVFQSGGTLQFWVEQAAARGMGFGYAITTGNEIDLDLADFLNFYVEDKNTKVIACLVEGVRRPKALMEVAKKAHVAKKPILMVKIGRTEAASEQAMSHTGALAGDDAVFDAMCRRYGIIRCENLADMVELAMVFEQGRIPPGNRMALVTSSGAVKGLALDAAGMVREPWGNLSEETAAKLKELISSVSEIDNPLDCGPAPVANSALYADICKAVLEDDQVDMLAFLARTPLVENEPDHAQAEPLAALAGATSKPIFAFAHLARPTNQYAQKFQREAGLPFIHGIPQAVQTMSALANFGESQRMGIAEVAEAARKQNDLTSDQLNQMFEKAGATLPVERRVTSIDEAIIAADNIGYPVALKLLSPDASHKTEVGGVKIGLSDARAVSEAITEIEARLDGKIRIDGYLVQEMVEGLEVIVGFREDPQYGPFVVVGLGGIFVEALKDTSLRLLPASANDVKKMISELRSSRLFETFRGQPARDVDALAQAVSALGDLFLEHRSSLSDLEINPMIVGAEGQGIRAVDVRPIQRS
jgi:acetate---CoA ligase (ADP-forming)